MNVPTHRQSSPQSSTVKTQLLELATLQFGDRGEEVEHLQHTLNSLGYDCGDVDGQYGDRTRSAVADAQRHFGLEADGTFNPATWYALTFWAREDSFAIPHWLRDFWQQVQNAVAIVFYPGTQPTHSDSSDRRSYAKRNFSDNPCRYKGR
ncbi:MAG: peptidoglycan-binding domain-containing protein [Cyanobacteria bacterium P01_E01_bin.34]